MSEIMIGKIKLQVKLIAHATTLISPLAVNKKKALLSLEFDIKLT